MEAVAAAGDEDDAGDETAGYFFNALVICGCFVALYIFIFICLNLVVALSWCSQEGELPLFDRVYGVMISMATLLCVLACICLACGICGACARDRALVDHDQSPDPVVIGVPAS